MPANTVAATIRVMNTVTTMSFTSARLKRWLKDPPRKKVGPPLRSRTRNLATTPGAGLVKTRWLWTAAARGPPATLRPPSHSSATQSQPNRRLDNGIHTFTRAKYRIFVSLSFSLNLVPLLFIPLASNSYTPPTFLLENVFLFPLFLKIFLKILLSMISANKL